MNILGKIFLRFAVSLLILLASFTSANAKTAKVLKVYDGDTFKVLLEDKTVMIRLYGIDSPESRQDGNISATRFLTRTVFGNLVEIKVLHSDWTGQLHAIVTKQGSGLDVNAAMVANGYSWVHPQKCSAEECEKWKELESNARKYKLGIWSGFNLVPPWEYKREGN
jgi:endonuclease YncB( thermonuclease family)